MKILATLALTILLATTASAQRVRSVRDLTDFSRILWIGAHPDDESLISPLLGIHCVESSSHCSLLVLTHGENGPCALAGGCGPDLGALRATELHSAAAALNATVDVRDLPDVMSDVIAQWDARSGGHAALVSAIRQAIEGQAPTVILTFDPRHGSTCHPAHVAVSALVTEAVAGMQRPPVVMFIETRARIDNGAYVLYRGVTSAKRLLVFDVAKFWHYLLDDMRAHASQFSAADIASLDTPGQYRTLLLLPSDASATYVDSCPD